MSKFSGILILPVGCVLLFYLYSKNLLNFNNKKMFLYPVLLILGAFIIIIFCYGFDALNLYFEGIKRIAKISDPSRAKQSV